MSKPSARAPTQPVRRESKARESTRRESKARESTRREELAHELRASGLKLTPPRLAIIGEIADDLTHPTAQDIFERLRGALPTMSFATVYNTLDALARAGLCVARSLTPGATRFDPNVAPHHHAVCDRCGAVSDLPVKRRRGGEPAGAPPGFSVRVVEQIVRGTCARCEAPPRSPRFAGPRARPNKDV